MLHGCDAGSVLVFELYIASTTGVGSCHDIIGSKRGRHRGTFQMAIPQERVIRSASCLVLAYRVFGRADDEITARYLGTTYQQQ